MTSLREADGPRPRRSIFPVVAVIVAFTLGGCAGAHARPRSTPEGFVSVDRAILAALRHYDVQGATVAIAYRGTPVHVRGYGQARPDGRPVTPATRMRLASLTKPITAVIVHRLVEAGRLDLDARIAPLLGLVPPDPTAYDARWDRITVRQLLEHAGGFDRAASFDPMFANDTYAKMFRRPVRPDDLDFIVSVMLQRPLDFDPGSDQVYSNFGYSLLGAVIEKVTGVTYEANVDALLSPRGATSFALGHELPADRPVDEAWYFPDPNDEPRPNLFSAAHELVSPADGGFYFRPMAAHGGLIATAADYLRFLTLVDGYPDPPDVLSPEERARMLARPDVPTARDAEDFYADGWDVIPTSDGPIHSHTGAKPGTTTVAVVRPDGYAYVVLSNGRPLEGDFVEALDLAVLENLPRR